MALTATDPMTWLLLVGAVGAYASVAMTPTRLAGVVHLGVTAIVATGLGLAGYGEAAVAMVSGGAVCVLLLCGGLVLLTGKPETRSQALGTAAMLILPAGMVLMFVGLRGRLDAVGVVLLLVLAGVSWWAGKESEIQQATERLPVTGGLGSAVCAVACAMVLGGIVAAVWGLAVTAGIGKGAQFAPGVMGMAILAPAMMFPLVGVSGQLANETRAVGPAGAVSPGLRMLASSAAGLLTVVLPLAAIAAGPGRSWAVSMDFDQRLARAVPVVLDLTGRREVNTAPAEVKAAASRPVVLTATGTTGATGRSGWPIYPMVSWRIDSAVFVVTGMILVGLRLGLVRDGRLLGGVAVAGYGVYLVAGVIVAVIM